jgi:hypothetical protein
MPFHLDPLSIALGVLIGLGISFAALLALLGIGADGPPPPQTETAWDLP